MSSTPFQSPQVVSLTFALFRVPKFRVFAVHDHFVAGSIPGSSTEMNVVADPERIKTDRHLIPLAQRRDLGGWEFVGNDYPSVCSGVLRALLDQAET
jgi:hypothetical protein